MKSIAFISVLALAAGSAVALSGPGAGMIVLHPTQSGALSLTGNSEVYVPTRAIYVNSDSEQAVRTSGNATIDTPVLNVVGGVSFSGQSMVTGEFFEKRSAVEDPLDSCFTPLPDRGDDHGSISISGGTHELRPGYYPGGIDISGNADVTLAPGIYQVDNGFKFNSGRLHGERVTIIMLGGAMDLAGNSHVKLSPPDNGHTVVIFQPSDNTSVMSLAGTADVQISGAIYAPGSHILLLGTSEVEGEGPTMGDLVIASTVELRGTATIRIGREGMMAIVPMGQHLCD